MLQVDYSTSKRNSNIKTWIFFIFMCFPAFYPWLNKMIGSASLAHLLLIFLTYVPLVYLFTVKKEPFMKMYLYFILGIVSVFSFYMVINFKNDFMFESYALPSTITFFSGIIGFFIMAIQDDPVKLKKCFKVITIILVIYYYTYTFDIENAASYMWGYDMFLGFRMLLPCLFSLNFALDDKEHMKLVERIFWISMTALSAYVILAYGSRGPLLGIFMFFIMKYGTMFLPRRDISMAKKFFVSVLIIAVMLIIYINFTKILLAFSGYLDTVGISSRTISRFLSGSATYDNGRLSLFSMAFEKINAIGYGPFSDQFYFGEGNYVHNFVIEILFDFGMLGGTLVLVVLIYKFVKVLKQAPYSPWFEIFAVLFSYCFGRLLFSGTFWTETSFWMLLGAGYVCLRDAKMARWDNESSKKSDL